MKLVVAMDSFTGFKTAAAEELPDAVTVMDPFRVVRLAGDALDRCRRRTQQDLHGHRGRATDPSTAHGGSCTLAATCSPTSSAHASTRCSPSMSTSRSKPPGPSINA